MINDEKIKEIQSAVDEDAKQGYKSEENSFFGYKNHVAMTKERIVTGLDITSGEAPDGKYLKTLVENTEKAGIKVEEVIGDKAYSGRENLEYGEEKGIKIIARTNAVITNSKKPKDDGFEYIKDADTMRCPMGELAIKKYYRKEQKTKDGYESARMEYRFDPKTCEKCPIKEKCRGKSKKIEKIYTIGILSNIHKNQKEFEETEYFNNILRNERYKIEAKNAETKLAHGLCKAKYVGLFRMRVQSYLTHIVTNIKRIITLTDDKLAIT